ncbi:hypothetical protein Scep_014054 [Stephania cephalantha]|uniref:Uncharacterized protein n=1 Tax=Stephania cephalantha TaxID=152367 RepID=A0AAP0J2C9_9MAGN
MCFCAALRRFQAVAWLESFVGPIGLLERPTEKEFVSCLRNGILLCNAINKIQPGAVSKVIEGHSASQVLDSQPLPAFQHFENVRNFLVAVKELSLPAFEASDLERDSTEAASTVKIVDCILALKSYHEWKQWNGGTNGSFKCARSPIVPRIHSTSRIELVDSSKMRKHLDMSMFSDKLSHGDAESRTIEETIVRKLVDGVLDTKDNIDGDMLDSIHHGNMDSAEFFRKIVSCCLHERQLNQSPEDLKSLLSSTRNEFAMLESQWQSDMNDLGRIVQELSDASIGYERVLQENKDLYNTVQDLKGNIRVYCRIRPLFDAGEGSAVDFIGDDGSLVVVDPLKPHREARKIFHFNRVFGPIATLEEIFKDTQPLIRSVMDGYNVCIFAYGQTGSGKTYTMCGPSGGTSNDAGINHLALNDLFHISCSRKDLMNYVVEVQMVEVYNEQVRDLLTDDFSAAKYPFKLLFLAAYPNHTSSLPDAKTYVVNSTVDVLNLMKLGEMNRVACSTAMNNQSSRSHSILTVHVRGKDSTGNTIRSCLHLVDLAGSERVDKSEVTGDRLKEAQYINRSLSCLGDVIAALAQKNSHIPYRNSKLTQILQSSLGGHAKTLMIAHISPEAVSYGETLSTLKFAQRVSTVELGAAHLNKESTLSRKEAQTVRPRSFKENENPVPDLTPPRLRRLSIESSTSVKTEKVSYMENNRYGSKTVAAKSKPKPECSVTRPRRLSLEGAKPIKKNLPQIQTSSVSVSRIYELEAQPCAIPDPSQQQTNVGNNNRWCHSSEADMRDRNCSGTDSLIPMYNSSIPRSPTSSARQIRRPELVGRSRVQPIHSPKTPEPPSFSIKEEVQALTPLDLSFSNRTQIPSYSASTTKNGSKIKKSLHTIGKLINPSEKRNHKSTTTTTTTPIIARSLHMNGTLSDIIEGPTPLTANARTKRRQSLIGVQNTGVSRRSSLGGKSSDHQSHSNEKQRSRTPPPANLSNKTATKPWF